MGDSIYGVPGNYIQYCIECMDTRVGAVGGSIYGVPGNPGELYTTLLLFGSVCHTFYLLGNLKPITWYTLGV